MKCRPHGIVKGMLWTAYPAEFGQGVYAILKGKVVEFMVTSNSITLGQNSAAEQVDSDLSLDLSQTGI